METLYSIFEVLFILLAIIGALAMIILLFMVLAVKSEILPTFRYEQDDNLDKQ